MPTSAKRRATATASTRASRYGKGPGAFRTGGDIVTEKSDAALVEFMKELKGIVGSRPVTDEELTMAKDALVQRLPATFASVSSINSALTTLWTQHLPDDYYQQYANRLRRSPGTMCCAWRSST